MTELGCIFFVFQELVSSQEKYEIFVWQPDAFLLPCSRVGSLHSGFTENWTGYPSCFVTLWSAILLYRAFTQLGLVAAQVSGRNSREFQGPEGSQNKGAYIPCTFLNVILYAQVRFLHHFLCLPENLSGQRLPWRIFSKYIFYFAYRCILQKVRELRFRIPISTVRLHCLATQNWGEASSVQRAEERR